MLRYLKWTSRLALLAVVLLAVATSAWAQTPEGTVITNTATATYTDANGNAYTPVTGSVSVTVGFKAGVTVTANTPSPSAASPSTADTMTFTVANVSNGTDSMTISEAISVGGVITVTGYRFGATTYGTLAALNSALASVGIAQGGSIVLKIVFDVASGQGGVTTVYTLTATSRRTPATSGNAASTITPITTYGVAVTPDGGQNVQRIPGNGYSFTFAVQNNGNGNDNFDVIASSPGSPVITIVSVNGVAGDSSRIALPASASQNIVVVYNVANVAGGSTDTLSLLGRSVGQPATTDQGFMDLTVIKPNLTLTKAAYLDDGVTPVASGVVPGQIIRFRFTVINNGATSASTVQVTDALPAQVTYVSTSSSTGWSVSVAGQNVTANYTGTGGVLAASASATFELRVSIN
ncbi:MAG TPA: hypothetical protein VGQ48_04355 [Gemmatimonadales bacterium]|jgi:uncharacterized repeat protein (TIGR01451 family)|nr:hypothetical protein [Gemmatimonadales bacterium]